jgi:hypothetical protein
MGHTFLDPLMGQSHFSYLNIFKILFVPYNDTVPRIGILSYIK